MALLRAKAAIGKLTTKRRRAGRHQHRAQGARGADPPIVENAGVEGSIVVGKITENKSPDFRLRRPDRAIVDMLSAGIIDPARSCVSLCRTPRRSPSLMITTEAMIAEAPKKKETPAMPGGGMGSMDY